MLDAIKACPLLLGLGMLAVSARLAAGQNPPVEELRTAAQVRSLTPQQAAAQLPVKLKGVVTFAMRASTRDLFKTIRQAFTSLISNPTCRP